MPVRGRRMFWRMMSQTASFGRPSSTTRIAGSWSPSWYTSVASGEIEPGTAPPISIQCVTVTAKATTAPPLKTGRIRQTSQVCVPPA